MFLKLREPCLKYGRSSIDFMCTYGGMHVMTRRACKASKKRGFYLYMLLNGVVPSSKRDLFCVGYFIMEFGLVKKHVGLPRVVCDFFYFP